MRLKRDGILDLRTLRVRGVKKMGVFQGKGKFARRDRLLKRWKVKVDGPDTRQT